MKRTNAQDDDDGDDNGSETDEIMFFLFLFSVEHARTHAKNRPLSIWSDVGVSKKQKPTAHKDGCRRLYAIIAAIVSGVWLMAFQGGSAIFRQPAVRIFKFFFFLFDSRARFTVRSIDDYECQTTMDPCTGQQK